MKTLNLRLSLNLCSTLILVVSLFNLGFSKIDSSDCINMNSKNSIGLVYPDSTFADTTVLASYGDTLESYLDGPDSVYVLSVGNDSMERLISTEDIIVRLTTVEKNVVDNNFGVSLADFFLPGHAPLSDNVNYPVGSSPWDLLSDLAPTVLRYPGGSSSKFRHPFGSMNYETWNDEAGKKNGGYGICLEEIITFYDRTNTTLNETLPEDIIADMEEIGPGEPELDVETDWLSNREISNFNDYYREWLNQPKYIDTYTNLYDEQLYINDLIELVRTIETVNPDLTVQVVLVVNILSDPAAQVRDVINYLQDATLNNNYSVHVYGIELGNECFFRVFEDLIGFAEVTGTVDAVSVTKSAFDHYWAFINGAEDYNTEFDWDDPTIDFLLSDVLPSSMFGTVDGFQAHDYIGLLRNDDEMDDIKIGIPAGPPIDADGPFIIDQDDIGDAMIGGAVGCRWNDCLYAHYGYLEDGKPAFDAVIAHLYYKSQNNTDPALNTNWGEIPIGIDSDPGLDGENLLDNDNDDDLHDDFATAPYTNYSYGVADLRVYDAFGRIVGLDNQPGNFREFLKSRQRIGMQTIGGELAFEVGEEDPKECWITEWNINNNQEYENNPLDPAYDADGDAKKQRVDVYNNSFVHSYLIQEEYLNNLKFNSHGNPDVFGLRNDLITVATIQSFLGGSSIQLVTNSNEQDVLATGLSTDCTPSFNFYVPRALYHSYSLLGPIHENDLNYLSTIKSMYETNLNLAPTVFVTQSSPTYTERSVYIYFSNVKGTKQTYVIKPGTFTTLPFTGINAEMHLIDVDQLYSNSGKSALYDINRSYDECGLPLPANYFEIQGPEPTYIDYEACPTNMPSDAMCATVPAYSIGYFVFSFDPSARLGEIVNKFQIFPNPASTKFIITQTNIKENELSNLVVRIYTMYGNLVYQGSFDENESIPIDDLPVGTYYIQISENNYLESEILIKMK